MKKAIYITCCALSLVSCKKEQKAEPKKEFSLVKIEAVTLTQFPTTRVNGKPWDEDGSSPDLFPSVEISGISKSGMIIGKNINNSNLPYRWTVIDSVIVPDFSLPCAVRLYRKVGTTNVLEKIAAFRFTLKAWTKEYPATISLIDTGGTGAAMDITLQWYNR